MALTKERKGEIAYLVLKTEMKAQLGNEQRRKIIHAAKQLNLDPQELMEFAREIAQESFNETYKSVSAKEISENKRQ